MTVIEERLALLDKLELDHGGHDSWEKGACVMEAVAAVAAAADADADIYKQAVEEAVKAKREGGGYWEQRSAAYQVFRQHYDEVFKKLAPGMRESVFQLINRLIEVRS